MAGNDVFLWVVPSDADPDDVRLRDPNTSGTTNYQVNAQAGSYSLTGQALTVSRNRVATVLNGTYSLSGQSLTVSRNRVATPTNGTYSLTGQSLTVSRNRVATPLNGVYSLSGQVITVNYAGGAVNYQINAQTGTYTVNGQAASIERSRSVVYLDGGFDEKRHKQHKKKNDKRRKDIEEAYALLIEHPEPSIVREVREIVGTAQLDTLAQPKITQLLTLAREVEEEELLLLLL